MPKLTRKKYITGATVLSIVLVLVNVNIWIEPVTKLDSVTATIVTLVSPFWLFLKPRKTKSDTVRKYTAAKGIKVIDIPLSNVNGDDLLGIPTLKKGK